MKLRITLKDPDGVYDCVEEAARESACSVKGLSGPELEELVKTRREELFDQLKKWIEYREYVEIEFNLDGGTATVLQAK